MKWLRSNSTRTAFLSLTLFALLGVGVGLLFEDGTTVLRDQLAALGHATLSVTIVAPSAPPGGGGDTGGGGGGSGGGGDEESPTLPTAVTLKGVGPPVSTLTVLVRGTVKDTARSATDGSFNIAIPKLTPGAYPFGVYATDPAGLRSRVYTFTVSITTEATTLIDDIGIPPTLSANKSATRRGDPVVFSGYAAPGATVELYLGASTEYIATARADGQGRFTATLPTLGLASGTYSASATMRTDAVSSISSTPVSFRVGDTNALTEPGCVQRADLNGDCKVNLVDFSIAAYWWERSLSEAAKRDVDANLWEDGTVDLRDFSILAYHWTG